MTALAGATIVIIGGSSGLGLATARAALGAGADVVLAGRSREKLAAAQQATDHPDRAQVAVCDITQDRDVAALLDRPRVDHVLLTAGDLSSGPVIDTPLPVLRAAIDLRLFGAVLLARHAAPVLPPGGSITHTSGAATLRPAAGQAVAAAAAGGVEVLARALAVELAPRRVNVINPGPIDTPLHGPPGPTRTAALAQAGDALPVGRVGTPAEYAAALLLMTNGFITGTTLHVDGGAPLAA